MKTKYRGSENVDCTRKDGKYGSLPPVEINIVVLKLGWSGNKLEMKETN